MRVLITGGNGFIGRNLAHTLEEAGHTVLIIDPRPPAVGAYTGACEWLPADIQRMGAGDLDASVRSCDCVVHLAATVGVETIAAENIASCVVNNFESSRRVIDACRRWGKFLVLFSTSEVYGTLESETDSFSEEDRLVLGSPLVDGLRGGYAGSKIVTEYLALAHHQAGDLPAVVVRPFNVSGPGQSPFGGMVIPAFIYRAMLGLPLIIYGDGSQARCFSHVRDVCLGVLGLIENRSACAGHIFNLGNDKTLINVNDLAQKIIEVTGSKSEVIYEAKPLLRKREVLVRRPDLTAIRAAIGYEPRYDLSAILSDAKEYISANFLQNVEGSLKPMPMPPRFEPLVVATNRTDPEPEAVLRRAVKLAQRYSRPIIFAIDVSLMVIAFVTAFVLRFDGAVPRYAAEALRAALPWAVAAQTAAYAAFRLNQGMWRYIGMWDCVKIAGSAATGAILFGLMNVVYLGIGVPLSIYVLAPLLQTLFLVGSRLAKRLTHEVKSVSRGKRLLIFGAGDAGEMIVRDMKYNPYYHYTPVGFVDDDPLKTGRRIHGVRVLGTSAALPGIIANHHPDEVLIAMPSVGLTTVRDILKTLEGYPVPVKTLPDVWISDGA